MASIYVAARFSKRPEANALAKRLMALGHTISSRWVKPDSDHVLPTGLSKQAADTERTRFALEDIEDVDNCDWCVSIMEPEARSNSRGGRHVEFGYALAKGKRMIVIGTRETVFHHLPYVEHYSDAQEFLRDCNAVLEATLQPTPQPGPDITLENAPIGTKAPAINGGHWLRVHRGWKWCTGATFPRPGGDWNGKLIAPQPKEVPDDLCDICKARENIDGEDWCAQCRSEFYDEFPKEEALQAGSSASQPGQADWVAMPASLEQARAMAIIGLQWLSENAPDELNSDPSEPLSLRGCLESIYRHLEGETSVLATAIKATCESGLGYRPKGDDNA